MSNTRDAGKWLVIFIVSASGQTTQMMLLQCRVSAQFCYILVCILGPGYEGEVMVTENSRVFRMRRVE